MIEKVDDNKSECQQRQSDAAYLFYEDENYNKENNIKMATNQDKIATIGDIRNLLRTAKEKGVTIKNESGAEWTIPSSFNDDSLCVTYRQLNGTVLPQYSSNATDKISSTDGVVISNFKGGTVAYSDNQLVRLGDITLKSVYLADSSFEVGVTSSANTSCAVSATCQYTYDVNEASYTYEATAATITTVTSSGTSGTWSGTDSPTSNTLSDQGANSSFTDTRSFTISCSTTIGGQNVSDSTTIVQPTREQGKVISSTSTADSHELELTVDNTSFGCDGGAANVTIYHVYGSATSTTYEDTCGVQYTVVSGDGRQRKKVGTAAYTIPAISCNTITGSKTSSHTLTTAYTYQDSAGVSHEITGSTSVSQECESCQMAYKYTMTDGTVQSGTCFFDTLAVNTIQGSYYHKAQKIEIFDCITGFSNSNWNYFGGDEVASITMSDNVVALPQEFAFGAEKLTNVKLSAKLKTIPTFAFSHCSGLKEINFIPNGVEIIEQYAFNGCESASSATIPSSVTTIGVKAFDDCSKLKDIYMRPTTPPTIMSNTFVSLPNDYIIHVPCDSETAYKTASPAWKAISGHVKGDCSCTSCFHVQTNVLPSSGSGSEGFTCALVTVTGTNAICSQFNNYSAMPTDITPAEDYSWITNKWTSGINKGFALQIDCTENNTGAERYAQFRLSGEKCTDGIEINLTQPFSHKSCLKNWGKTYQGCEELPSGSELISCYIDSESDYCQRLKFISTAYTLNYTSSTITIESIGMSEDKKTLTVYGSMSKNETANKKGTNLSVSATTDGNDKLKCDIIIEQTACVGGECNCDNSKYMSWIRSCPSSGSSNIAIVTLSGTCNNITYDNATCLEDFVNITRVTTVNGGTSHPSFIVKGTVSRNTTTSSRSYNVTLTSNSQPCTYTATVTQNANTATICSDDKVIIKTCKNNDYIDVISDSEIMIGKQGNSGWSFVSLKAPKGKPKLTSATNIAYRIDFGSEAPWLQYIQRNNNGPFDFADNADICYFGCSTENTTGKDRTATMTITYTDSNGGVCETDITITQSGTEGTLPFQITGVTLQHLCIEDRKIYYTIDYQGTAPSTATCTVRTLQNTGNQLATNLTGVTVNKNLKSIPIHDGAVSGETISLTVIPDSGVNTSSTSFTRTMGSEKWTECGGTITLTSRAASILTTGTTSEMRYTLDLTYSGSKTIDTSNASITLYAYNHITTENKNCLQCVDLYDKESLCEYDISLTQNEIAKLVKQGSLRVTKTITIGNNSPSVCNYQDREFYGIYGRSNTTSIKIGDGFLANRLGH